MTILAIECSTPHASLAIWRDGSLFWEAAFTSERAHNARIFAPLEEGLEQCGRQLDWIAVGVGPGSYGGVRVGIAVANGFALALGAGVLGVSSLEAIDDGDDYRVIGDARRKSFFVGHVVGGVLEEEPDLVSGDELAAAFEIGGQTPIFTSDRNVADEFPAVRLAFPAACRLAENTSRKTNEELSRIAERPLEPHYLRAPYITTPKK